MADATASVPTLSYAAVARFTIDYETATEQGTIIGVLQDDGSVSFSIAKR